MLIWRSTSSKYNNKPTDRVINYLVHQVPDSTGVRPMAGFSVGHVDDVDLLKVNITNRE
jgi:hypothetical protein